MFFCRTEGGDRSVLERVGFYAQDLRLLDELGFEVKIATTLRSMLSERSADVYFIWWWTWAFVPIALSKIMRRPTIVTGVLDHATFANRPATEKLLHRFTLAFATTNVFVSRMEHDAVTASMSTRRPLYCPLVVDTERFSPGSEQRETFLLCIAGSGMQAGNWRRKCIAELVESFALVHRSTPSSRLVIIGRHGDEHAQLVAAARAWGVDEFIDFPGIVSEAEKVSLLRRCAIYLQPSRNEGFGLSILEAMSCGAPIVCSGVGAVPELVGDTAALADGTRPAEIAAAVRALLSDATERRRLGDAARRRAVEWFGFERRARFFGQLIGELSGTSGSDEDLTRRRSG